MAADKRDPCPICLNEISRTPVCGLCAAALDDACPDCREVCGTCDRTLACLCLERTPPEPCENCKKPCRCGPFRTCDCGRRCTSGCAQKLHEFRWAPPDTRDPDCAECHGLIIHKARLPPESGGGVVHYTVPTAATIIAGICNFANVNGKLGVPQVERRKTRSPGEERFRWEWLPVPAPRHGSTNSRMVVRDLSIGTPGPGTLDAEK